MERRKSRIAAGIVLGISLPAVAAEIIREIKGFRVRRYRIVIPKCKKAGKNKGEEIRIIFLSDLHGKRYGKGNNRLIEAVKRERPDYIFSGGDMLVRGRESTDKTAAELLAALGEIAPVFCANGNHEQALKERPDLYHERYNFYKEELEKRGVTILENSSVDLEKGGVLMTVTGLEIPVSYYGHFGERPLSVRDIKKRVQEPSPRRYQILLAHNPVYMDQYAKWGADLTLSGHLHGGIIRIPGIGGLITPQARLFPRYSGDLYQKGKRCGIVSRGLGTHTVNLRFLNMAEVVSVTLSAL